jgi:hypothetical protein
VTAEINGPGVHVELPKPREITSDSEPKSASQSALLPQPKETVKQSAQPRRSGSQRNAIALDSNLPAYLHARNTRAEVSPVILPDLKVATSFVGLKPGIKIRAIIADDIVASPSVPQPLVAKVISGELKGAHFFGEARLESDLNRVLVDFSTFHILGNEKAYALKASALGSGGSMGLTGKFHSHDDKYIAASLLTAGAAAFADATVNRSRTLMGDYVEEPSLDTASKKAVSATLNKSSERLLARAEKVPGYTEVKGPTIIEIIIRESPTLLR